MTEWRELDAKTKIDWKELDAKKKNLLTDIEKKWSESKWDKKEIATDIIGALLP